MKHLLPISVLLFSVSILLPGQNTDLVYLKTGSVLRGTITELVPSGHVKIEDYCGNIWNYPLDEVEKITSEPFVPPGRRKGNPGFDTGFVNITSMGVLAGSSDNAQVAPFSLQMVNGWRSGFGLFTGAGFGIEFLNTSYLPLFLEVDYDLPGTEVVPFVIAKGGYSLPMKASYSQYEVDYDYTGGLLSAGGIGLKIRTRPHFAWDVMLLYRYQRTGHTETFEYNGQEDRYTDIYNRIEIRIGFYID